MIHCCMNFVEDLVTMILDKQSVVCMGLDPRMESASQIPRYLIDQYDNPNDIIIEFNKALIDGACDLIPVIKPQIAFYEQYFAYDALRETVRYAHKKDLLVIIDSKRNDIGTTAEAYAKSMFDVYKCDACTVNGYIGSDGITPFLKFKNKGIFVIVKTSNPSSHEFQDLFSGMVKVDKRHTEFMQGPVKLERNFVQMARLVEKWAINLPRYDEYCNLGVVISTTTPEEMLVLRNIVKDSFILIPGYGTQGLTAKDMIGAFDTNGLGALVNSSRGIMFAHARDKKCKPEQFVEAAREEILRMDTAINKEIELHL